MYSKVYAKLVMIIFLGLLSLNAYSITHISTNPQKILSIAFRKSDYSLNFLKEFNHSELHIHSAIYSGLLTPNPVTLQPEVGLAVSWIINDTQDEYIFNLRKNAKFSDGTNLTTQDVKDSWIAAIKEKNAFITLFELIAGVTEYINGEGDIKDIGIEIINPYSIKILLKSPAPYFLTTITHPAFSISSSAQVKKQNWDSDPLNIVQSGPFVISAINDKQLTLIKNKHFWAAKNIYFEKVQIKFYLPTEELDMIEDINAGRIVWSTFYTEGADALDNQDWLLVHPIFGSKYLFFRDTNSNPWKNHKIRQAIKMLIPFDSTLEKQYIFPATGLVPTMQGFYENDFKIPKQDTETALAILEEEGFAKGEGLGPITFLVPQYSDGTYDMVFDTIKESLDLALDTSVEIKTVEASKYYDTIQENSFTIGVTSWIGDFADPAAFLQIWGSPNAALGHNYNDKQYQTLLRQSDKAKGNERTSKLIDTEKYLLDTAVVLPLHYLYAVNVVRTDLLKGWNTNLLDVHLLGFLYNNPPKPLSNITLLNQ